MVSTVKKIGSVAGKAAKSSAKVLNDFAQAKKDKILINIQNSGALGILVKWLITNKVSVVLTLAVIFYVGRYYYLENEYLRERNKTLVAEQEEILNKTKELEIKIDKLREKTKKYNELNKIVRENAGLLNSEQKKEAILKLVERLKRRRGIK